MWLPNQISVTEWYTPSAPHEFYPSPTFAQSSSHELTLHCPLSPSPPQSPCLPQVQQSQEKIARLEQEKEHWLLEAQLGRVRLEKETQRITELEAQLSSALGGNLTPLTAPSPSSPALHDQDDTETEERGVGKEATLSTSLVQHS